MKMLPHFQSAEFMDCIYFARQISAGQRILIYGSGGSIGTFAVQIAKLYRVEVTSVDRQSKLDMLRTLGADQVIDYMKEDFTRSGNTYDAIIDVVGKSSYSGCLKCLKPNGRYVLGNPGLSATLKKLWTTMTSDKKVISGTANYKAEDYAFLINLIETGKVKPVIDRRYPLEQMAEAHRYVDSGQKKGNVIITVGHNDQT